MEIEKVINRIPLYPISLQTASTSAVVLWRAASLPHTRWYKPSTHISTVPDISS